MRGVAGAAQGAGVPGRRSPATQEPSYFVLAGRFRFQSTARDRRGTLISDDALSEAAIDDSRVQGQALRGGIVLVWAWAGPGGYETEGCSVEIRFSGACACRHAAAPGPPVRSWMSSSVVCLGRSFLLHAFPTIAPSRSTHQPPNLSRGRCHGSQGLSHVKPPACH